jgi:hypothetical protein
MRQLPERVNEFETGGVRVSCRFFSVVVAGVGGLIQAVLVQIYARGAARPEEQ